MEGDSVLLGLVREKLIAAIANRQGQLGDFNVDEDVPEAVHIEQGVEKGQRALFPPSSCVLCVIMKATLRH